MGTKKPDSRKAPDLVSQQEAIWFSVELQDISRCECRGRNEINGRWWHKTRTAALWTEGLSDRHSFEGEQGQEKIVRYWSRHGRLSIGILLTIQHQMWGASMTYLVRGDSDSFKFKLVLPWLFILKIKEVVTKHITIRLSEVEMEN